jgi:hypothetical protein
MKVVKMNVSGRGKAEEKEKSIILHEQENRGKWKCCF